MRILLLGCNVAGKSASGNTILGRRVFDSKLKPWNVYKEIIADRLITVAEAPGWERIQTEKQIITADLKYKTRLILDQCNPGAHAVLLVMNIEFTFKKQERKALEENLRLLGETVWSHTIVLFTHGDSLRDQTIEQHIQSGGEDLQWLLEKCGNRYHVFNNKKRDDNSQVTELLEKIDEMVAGHDGRLFDVSEPVPERKTEEQKQSSEARTWKRDPAELRLEQMDTHTHSHGEGSSTDVEFLSEKLSLEDAVVFTPDKTPCDSFYRILSERTGEFKCKLTDLVFEMEGEVLYRIKPWDWRRLDHLAEMLPAGPLYEIQSDQGSVQRLHLPHCEISGESRLGLVVAHFTDCNVEIRKPLKVTNTHVIVDIQGLSLFSLLKSKLFKTNPINAQILLFYKERFRERNSKLNVHLLPSNVPVKEVQKQHQSNIYIETSSQCELTPDESYKPCCEPYAFQPKVAKFSCDYGANYHPTFEVFLNTKVKEVTLSLLKKSGQEVWEPRRISLEDLKAASVQTDIAGADFVDEHRAELIQRVNTVMEIADRLLTKKLITPESHSKISEEATPQQKMRSLFTFLTSVAAKSEFHKILRELQPDLLDELESGPSRN